MVNLAVSSIITNKLLSTAKANLGKLVAFIGLISLQGVLGTLTYAVPMAVMIAHVLGGTALDWGVAALAAAFITSFIVEGMVLVLHLADMHKQALWVLIAVGIVGWLKMVHMMFPNGTNYTMDDIVLFLTMTLLSAITPFGAYYLCKGIANDKQLHRVYLDGIKLEDDILAAENTEDDLYVTAIKLKAGAKKLKLQGRYTK